MSEPVKKILSGAMFLAIAATSAHSLPTRSFERAELFANCAGLFSALATHQDGYGKAGVEHTRELAETFELLLDATLPEAYADGVPESEPTKWRSRGWSEMASLLADAHFSFDTLSADAANAALDQRIMACTSVVLPTETALQSVTRTGSPMR